jgi:hypothetical protein
MVYVPLQKYAEMFNPYELEIVYSCSLASVMIPFNTGPFCFLVSSYKVIRILLYFR